MCWAALRSGNKKQVRGDSYCLGVDRQIFIWYLDYTDLHCQRDGSHGFFKWQLWADAQGQGVKMTKGYVL